MKGIIGRKCFFLALGIIFLSLTACTEPSPLYGSWADNRGNKISFFADNTFSARIQSAFAVNNYEGNYSILLNSMTLISTSSGAGTSGEDGEDGETGASGGDMMTIVTEWDIRGNMLYLNWPREDGTLASLTLYKTSN